MTSHGYNSRGLLTSITDPLLKVTTYGYDDVGRMTSETNPSNKTTNYRGDGPEATIGPPRQQSSRGSSR